MSLTPLKVSNHLTTLYSGYLTICKPILWIEASCTVRFSASILYLIIHVVKMYLFLIITYSLNSRCSERGTILHKVATLNLLGRGMGLNSTPS